MKLSPLADEDITNPLIVDDFRAWRLLGWACSIKEKVERKILSSTGMFLFSAVALLSFAKPLDFSSRPHREKASDEVMRLAVLPELTRLCTEASNLTRAYRKSLL